MINPSVPRHQAGVMLDAEGECGRATTPICVMAQHFVTSARPDAVAVVD
jgi:hypothetical protein